jgi:hypothetical protein
VAEVEVGGVDAEFSPGSLEAGGEIAVAVEDGEGPVGRPTLSQDAIRLVTAFCTWALTVLPPGFHGRTDQFMG